MCGIAGIYHYGRPEAVERAQLEKMNACMIHRGPNDGGVYANGPIGLAMRRLAIIDLASGRQPMSNADESVWIVFNGEIYNFQELRDELMKKGRAFRTTSDTEVILHLYDEMGEDCVKRLRGMFAFSIWDERKKKLLLARDRIGKKPLLYTMGNGRLCWASEMQALVEAPDVPRDVNLNAIDLYLGLQYIPSPHTAFEAVKKLPPAHTLVYEKGAVRITKYWDLPRDQHQGPLDIEEAKSNVREILTEATRLRMISEVPLGAFLSGGVDSSVVVGLMSQLSTQPVRTFVIGFEEEEFSEIEYARIAAKHFGTNHTEFIVKPEMAEILPMLARHYGEPFGDSSALPTYYVARETRQHVTVALNGDGGDENFGGYMRYRVMKTMACLDWIPRGVRSSVGSLRALLPSAADAAPLLRKMRRLLGDVLPSDPLSRYLMVIGIFFESHKRQMYSDAFTDKLGGVGAASAYIADLFKRSADLDPVNQLLSVDFSSYLPECLMTKMDIATMANSVEGRSPLLDHKLIEYVFRLPGAVKLKGYTQSKWLLKEAFKDMLPPAIQTRGKMGFGIPLGAWFRGQLREFWRSHVMSEAALGRGYFREAYIRRLYDEHVDGKCDHGYRMWNLLMLELWHEAYAPHARVS